MIKKRMNADRARELFLEAIMPLTETELLPVEDCDSRVIPDDIFAEGNVPDFIRAAMDGYAVMAKDTLGASRNSPVVLEVSKTNDRGTCMWVHTGSPMPEGSDAVVMVEDTELRGKSVEIFTQVHPLKNVGEAGEDIRKGELITSSKSRLRPCDIAVLASLGIRQIKVLRKPVVAIIPTGEELVPRSKRELSPGVVYETNGLMSALYARKWGSIPRLCPIVTDDPEHIKKAILSNLDADIILISGGTSVGKRDYVPGVVGSLGNLLVHGVGISPGKPTAIGFIKGKPVVCMPGYPVAGFAALYWFVRPALEKLGNFNETFRTIRAELSEKIASRTGFKTLVRVKMDNGKAIPIAVSGAGILSSISKADGLVIIPENIEGLDASEEVEVILIE
jgi:molybdopterin molybdotransferase